jgi:hypothetical protein
MANDNANEAAKGFARSTSRCQSPAAAAHCAHARWPYVDADHKAIGPPRDAQNRKVAI